MIYTFQMVQDPVQDCLMVVTIVSLRCPWPQNRVHAWAFLTFEPVSGADRSTKASPSLLEVLHEANGFSTGHSGESFASRLALHLSGSAVLALVYWLEPYSDEQSILTYAKTLV